ncbi:MAG: SixA phosphatase family protein [Bacteroidota bacterium]
MKHLYLVRHAHTLEKLAGQSDKMRDLSALGEQQCHSIGTFLRTKKYPIDLMLTSDALRAVATANRIAEYIHYPLENIVQEGELYQSSIPEMLQLLGEYEACHHILIVAHNPTLTYFAEYYSGETLREVSPGTLIFLRTSQPNWRDLTKDSMHLVETFIPE